MAKKIDHRQARIPPPSKVLLGRMGAAAYRSEWEFTRLLTPQVPKPAARKPWSELDPNQKEVWIEVAKSVYAVVAKTGGAKVDEIKEPL